MKDFEKATLLAEWAIEEGFDRAGTTALAPLRHGPSLVSWLAAGRQAGMRYLARRLEARLDPREIFPGARSALCVALQYWRNDASAEPSGDMWRGVARYARGRDYHDVMGGMLDALSKRIEAGFPGCKTRWYVDTGPVLERELAALAGLGSVGKNTCLLDPDAGSWFFVGEIFTSLELAEGTPVADLCGTCARCLEACPTGALTEPYCLDSTRCISYWTIEHRGSLPVDIRPELEGWVFGCDLCQEVCPVNAGSTVEPEPEFSLPPQRSDLGLEKLLALDVDSYRRLFRGSPMKRAKLSGLKRNAAVAIGNSGDRRYIRALGAALEDEDPVVRGHAGWALGRLGGSAAREVLAAALEREGDAEVQRELRDAVRSIERSP